MNTVLEHVQSGNPRFLYAALNAFSPSDVKAFFEAHGVPLKTERGNRVFPVSDKAADIAEALRRAAEVLSIAGVCLMNGRHDCPNFIAVNAEKLENCLTTLALCIMCLNKPETLARH